MISKCTYLNEESALVSAYRLLFGPTKKYCFWQFLRNPGREKMSIVKLYTKSHSSTISGTGKNKLCVTGYVFGLVRSSKFGKTFWGNTWTSSAGSATLEDTRWARLYLASLNLPDSQFCLESKTEPKCSRHRTQKKWR